MKKSGLADSPFFTPSTPPPTAPTPPAVESIVLPPTPHTEVFAHENAQPHKRADAQPHRRATAQTHNRTDAQAHERASTPTHKAALDDETRGKTRESFDIYQDQNEAIEQLRMRWKKEQGRHFTKGEIMRILLDEILPSKG